MIKYYLSIYNTHPWPSNKQLEVKCQNRTEAENIARLLSALNGVPVRISMNKGYKNEGDFVYSKLQEKDGVMSYK